MVIPGIHGRSVSVCGCWEGSRKTTYSLMCLVTDTKSSTTAPPGLGHLEMCAKAGLWGQPPHTRLWVEEHLTGCVSSAPPPTRCVPLQLLMVARASQSQDSDLALSAPKALVAQSLSSAVTREPLSPQLQSVHDESLPRNQVCGPEEERRGCPDRPYQAAVCQLLCWLPAAHSCLLSPSSGKPPP